MFSGAIGKLPDDAVVALPLTSALSHFAVSQHQAQLSSSTQPLPTLPQSGAAIKMSYHHFFPQNSFSSTPPRYQTQHLRNCIADPEGKTRPESEVWILLLTMIVPSLSSGLAMATPTPTIAPLASSGGDRLSTDTNLAIASLVFNVIAAFMTFLQLRATIRQVQQGQVVGVRLRQLARNVRATR
ncbi:hypothetical protein GGR55DRAFT_680003 [Xylaria sp. FL0064]|nr:hypothetical protein GGR55DRAFT_680003 [Xylaria sp. FL0064]